MDFLFQMRQYEFMGINFMIPHSAQVKISISLDEQNVFF